MRARAVSVPSSASLSVAALGALLALILILVSACAEATASGPFSNTGQAANIVIASQPVYGRANCSEPSGAQVNAGDTVIDLGTVGTNCEQIVFLQDGAYNGLGYLPVYGMRRAAGGVRCRADVACNLRAGPGTTFVVIGSIGPGASAKGYWTQHTGAIITDGVNYSWWEVVDPVSGQRADIYGPDCQVF
jgi:hypothetical protein